MPILIAACATLALAPAQPDEPAGFDAAWTALVESHHASLAAERVVGATLVFVQAGTALRTAHYGFADRATERAVDDDTIWHWASITKTLTTIAVLQLRDRERVSLEHPIVRFLPELRQVHDPFGPIDAITLRHLLTHASGFRATTFPWGGDEDWMPYEPAEWSQVAALMPYTKIHFEPGTSYGYSNPGFSMLGRVVEIVTGDDIEVYLAKNIFMPLGLTRSYFDVTPYHLAGDRSNNYTVRESEAVPNGLELDTGVTVGNGGWNAPLADLVRYLAFLTGALDTEPARSVIARASLEEAWQPVRVTGTGQGLEQHIGMGCFVIDYRAAGRDEPIRLLGHTGTQKGFRSFVYWHPESRTAAIFAANTTDPAIPRAESVRTEVRAALFETLFPLFVN